MKEDDILNIIENIASSNRDITLRKLEVCEVNIYILFISQITDKASVSENIIKPILSYKWECVPNSNKIGGSVIYAEDISLETDKDNILNLILEGNTVILIPGDKSFIKVNTLKVEKRGVDLPRIQTAVRAPKDAFTENLDTNLSLIRYRIKVPSLTIEYFTLGERTKTSVAVIYLKDVVNEDLVNNIKGRLSSIKVDRILEAGDVQKLILGKSPLFPEMGIAERSDSACGHILDGRVCILPNGSNLALIAPLTVLEFLDSGEDHYDHSYIGIFVKMLRILSVTLSLILPSIYVAIVAFHPDILPSQYILTLASSRVTVPVNAILEAFSIEITGEILREGSIRLPKQIGPTVSIVGTIIIGQAAVSAGLISPLMAIIVSLSIMTSFASPDYGFMNPIRLLKYMILSMTGVFGIFGLLMGINIVAIRITSTTSFGVPYTAPIAPFSLRDVSKFFYTDINFEKTRASYLKTKDKKRK